MGSMAVHPLNIFSRGERQKTQAETAEDRALVERRLESISKSIAAVMPEATDGRIKRRKSPRKSVFLQARLITESLTRIRCQVIDLCADGARVVLDRDHDVTPFVTLRFDRSGVTRKARVAWRYQNELGLAFRARKTPAEPDERQSSAA